MHRHIALLLSLLLCALSMMGGPAVERFTANPAINPVSAAVLVMDLNTGEVIESHNANAPLVPASIMKSVTIASTIGASGNDYRYHTRLYADGNVNNGVLDGNLLVVGSGDPSLNSCHEPESPDFIDQCIDVLKQLGVSEITGSIVTDESVFTGPAVPESWMNEDLKHSYGTGCHGLNFADNSSGSSSVANPAGVLVSRLRAAASAAGISIGTEKRRESGARVLILDHQSAPIAEIMRSCMMRSDNMFAESLLRTFALLSGKHGSTSDGAELEMKLWKQRGADVLGVKIVDGSGLSRSNRLTAAFLADVLRQMSDDVEYVSFFPLAGQEGTLKRFLANTPLDSYIALKTGSMKGIQCYAGYKLDDDFAPTHVVVVIINNMPASRDAARKATQDMLLEIFHEDETAN